MASPELAIAKATLSATLFRADPTSVPRSEVDAFFPLLSTTVAQCSRPNVQKCKAWIVGNVAPSGGRSAALGKFLVAFSKSLAAEDESEGRQTSVKRRRLHILYILNDVLFHEVIRQGNIDYGNVWDAVLPVLFSSAASFDNCPKHIKKLEDLISLWDDKHYFPSQVITRFQEALTDGPEDKGTAVDSQLSQTPLKVARDAPYVLPSLHGDPASSWYDLPAGTWLPHLTPNSTKPMVPDLIRPIRLAQGPADSKLANAVKALLADVDRIYSKERKMEDSPYADLSELGERTVIDEITGEVIGGETYYGWSRQFCERMKERKKTDKGDSRGRSPARSQSRSVSRSRSDSRSRSRSYSPPSFKRQRVSSHSQSRKRSLSRSRSRSRSQNRSRRRRSRSSNSDRHRNDQYSRSRSRSRSRSPDRSHGNGLPQPHRSASRSGLSPLPSSWNSSHQPPPSLPHAPPSMPFPPVSVQPFNQGGFPIPPPPPMGYQGHWPPAPPPLPPSMMGTPPQGWMPGPGIPIPQMMVGWGADPNAPPPPPPPPPPPYAHQVANHHQNNHFGRGGGGFRGRGRGGYDRGGYRGR